MTPETTQLLGAAATLYGLGGDVSVRFFAVYVGGFAIWLLYGLGTGDVPIIVVHAVGLVCGTVTLAVALNLRRTAAGAATSRSAGEGRAQARPGLPPQREPDHRARVAADRVGGRRAERAHAARDAAEEICV